MPAPCRSAHSCSARRCAAPRTDPAPRTARRLRAASPPAARQAWTAQVGEQRGVGRRVGEDSAHGLMASACAARAIPCDSHAM
eukprot:187262-Chlamydomonas_euryale.AAC.1